MFFCRISFQKLFQHISRSCKYGKKCHKIYWIIEVTLPQQVVSNLTSAFESFITVTPRRADVIQLTIILKLVAFIQFNVKYVCQSILLRTKSGTIRQSIAENCFTALITLKYAFFHDLGGFKKLHFANRVRNVE